MNQVAGALNELLARISGSWSAYLVAVASLGTLTMAIIQALKDATSIRRWFQMIAMKAWLRRHADLAALNFKIDVSWCKAEEQIIHLATDGDRNAFYDLEIEKLCGQWNAAVQIVIDYPEANVDFFACVAARAQDADFQKLLKKDLPDLLPPNVEVKLDPEQQKHRMAHRQAFVDARTRVTHQVQRAVDAFQISTSFRWKWLLQFSAQAISFVLAFAALASGVRIAPAIAFASALLAGFLAPVARDLVAAVQQLRK